MNQRLEFLREMAKNEKIGNHVLLDTHDRAPCSNGPCLWFAVGTHDRVSNMHDRAACASVRKPNFLHF